MLVNIDAEMSEILSVYPHFQSLAAPFHSVEYENWVTEVGRSLYAKGGGSLVRKVLIELRHAPEGYSCASAWKSRPVSGVIGVQNPTTS